MRTLLMSLCFLSAMTVATARADTPASLLATYKTAAAQENTAFTAFSADRGRQFFASRHGADWSCSSCHTSDPRQSGHHAVTNKVIAPMAPAVNPERFSDAARVEKWFRRNCKDVLGRACTATEKGDVVIYLQSLR